MKLLSWGRVQKWPWSPSIKIWKWLVCMGTVQGCIPCLFPTQNRVPLNSFVVIGLSSACKEDGFTKHQMVSKAEFFTTFSSSHGIFNPFSEDTMGQGQTKPLTAPPTDPPIFLPANPICSAMSKQNMSAANVDIDCKSQFWTPQSCFSSMPQNASSHLHQFRCQKIGDKVKPKHWPLMLINVGGDVIGKSIDAPHWWRLPSAADVLVWPRPRSNMDRHRRTPEVWTPHHQWLMFWFDLVPRWTTFFQLQYHIFWKFMDLRDHIEVISTEQLIHCSYVQDTWWTSPLKRTKLRSLMCKSTWSPS